MFNKLINYLVIVFIFLSSLICILKAEFGDWVTYSAISRSSDIIGDSDSDDNRIIYATDGGVFIFNPNNGEYRIIDNDDGLYNINISTISVDFRDVLWAVNKSGTVTLFQSDFNEFNYLTDLSDASIEVNKVYSSEKYVYIAADKAFIRYKYDDNFNSYQVKDSNLDVEDVTDVIVFNNNIYISTEAGIYFVNENSENISALNPIWSSNSLPNSIKLNKFFVHQDKLYALTSEGIYELDETSHSLVTNNIMEENIIDGQNYNGSFYFLTSDISSKNDSREMYRAIDIGSDSFISIFSENNFTGTDDIFINNNIIYLTSALNRGIKFYSIEDNVFSDLKLNLPFGKGLKNVLLGKDNNLFYSSTHYFNYYNLEEDNWQKTTTKRENWIKNIFQDSRGHIFLGQWANGMSQYYINDVDSLVHLQDYKIFDTGSPQHPGVGEDSSGNIWFSNWLVGPTQRPSLVRLKPATVSDSLDYSYTEYNIEGMLIPYELYIDDYDWIWLGSSQESFSIGEGLAVCKLKGDGEDEEFVSSLINLDKGITSIIKDKEDVVWIGSNSGLMYMNVSSFGQNDDPINITEDNIESITEGPISSFIYDIEVNNLNEKWIATDKGISVLSAEGSSWRHYVTTDFEIGNATIVGELIRTPLLDAQITKITFDEDNGKVYFVSSNGICSFDYSGVSKDNRLKSNIATSPSPFMNDGYSIMKFIIPDDGSFYDSAKIFDLRGRLVKGGLTSDSFKILNGWDGRDNDGKIVSSGVYQVVIYDRNNPEKKLFGKIAVVRK